MGVPKHGRGVKLAEISGYSTSLVSDVLNGKKTCTRRFFKMAIDGLLQSGYIADSPQITLVPVWDTVPAGWPAETDVVREAPIDYVPVVGSGKNMGALLVAGHSMSPEIKEGEYVLYTQDYDLKPGDWIVATDEFNRPMVKEYALKSDERWLVSINPEYPSFKVNSGYRIVGKVVDIYSRRKAKRRG